MKEYLLKTRKWIGYALYVVLLTPVLMFYQFPSEALRDYIQATAHSKNPNLLVTFKKVSLGFPLSLKFTGAECLIQGDPAETVFKTKETVVRPKIWSLFGKNPEFSFTCQAYDGTIAGLINIRKNSRETMFNSSFKFDNIHIEDGSPLPAFIKDYVTGVLKGALQYSGGDLFNPDGTGEASLTLSKGSVKLTKPVMDIKAIDFKEVLIKADLKDQNLNISDIDFKGDGLVGQASGAVNLKNPINKSRLDLKVTIEPTAAFIQKLTNGNDAVLLLKQSSKKGKVSFTLKGTIEEPDFRLNQLL